MCIYKRIPSTNIRNVNPEIKTGFLTHYQRDGVRKTHLFENRYENIYLTEQHIPVLADIIAEAIKLAENILKLENLRAGFWFNYMPSGSVTTVHTHDDDDELLSAVYYVDVPESSGDLIIYNESKNDAPTKIQLTPKAGDFIFFKPDIRHEVSKNNSKQARLSIGINFGQPRPLWLNHLKLFPKLSR